MILVVLPSQILLLKPLSITQELSKIGPFKYEAVEAQRTEVTCP